MRLEERVELQRDVVLPCFYHECTSKTLYPGAGARAEAGADGQPRQDARSDTNPLAPTSGLKYCGERS